MALQVVALLNAMRGEELVTPIAAARDARIALLALASADAPPGHQGAGQCAGALDRSFKLPAGLRKGASLMSIWAVTAARYA
jgi:hypothetical protein